MKTPPKFVDYISNRSDYECAIYGAMGFSTSFISQKTGLTNCQVLYRLNKASIKRSDYRNGKSIFVQSVIKNSATDAKTQLQFHLRKVLGKKGFRG